MLKLINFASELVTASCDPLRFMAVTESTAETHLELSVHLMQIAVQ